VPGSSVLPLAPRRKPRRWALESQILDDPFAWEAMPVTPTEATAAVELRATCDVVWPARPDFAVLEVWALEPEPQGDLLDFSKLQMPPMLNPVRSLSGVLFTAGVGYATAGMVAENLLSWE